MNYCNREALIFSSLLFNFYLKDTLKAVGFYYVTYAFQSESTLYSCLNVKKLLARSKQAWYLKFKWLQQDRTHNHLVRVWIHLETPTVNDNLQQMHRTDKYSQHNSTIWPVWLNGWVFVYKLTGCVLESLCSHYIGQTLCYEQN